MNSTESKTRVYQSIQIRELEHIGQTQYDISGQLMMQRAGNAAFVMLRKRWPQAQNIVVFCGGGNNGGDGYVIARLAHEYGLHVTVYQIGDHQHQKDDAKNAYDKCRSLKIPMFVLSDKTELQPADIIVDAICGIGGQGNLREDVVAAIAKMQSMNVPILAIDIPSGIESDTGRVLGAAVHATTTVTFIGLKVGLLTGAGTAYVGDLICDDLQFPVEIFSLVKPIAEIISIEHYANYLKPRPRDWHKGLSGHVVIVGGDAGFSGAARLAAEAALRVGAGLVSVATRPENAAEMNINCPEIMCHGIETVEQLEPLLAKADVIVLGPGLGQSAWARKCWECVCEKNLPLVVDADGLNILSATMKKNDNWVLTPHPGEAARLLDISSHDVQQDRLGAIEAINKRYGGVCVLKGSGTLVFSPNSLLALCDKGNPGMASAGMGDVLSGVIGGLIAQGVPIGDAAKLGVYMHAAAGDMAAKEGERGTIATDLMLNLRKLANLDLE